MCVPLAAALFRDKSQSASILCRFCLFIYFLCALTSSRLAECVPASYPAAVIYHFSSQVSAKYEPYKQNSQDLPFSPSQENEESRGKYRNSTSPPQTTPLTKKTTAENHTILHHSSTRLASSRDNVHARTMQAHAGPRSTQAANKVNQNQEKKTKISHEAPRTYINAWRMPH